MSWLNHTGKRIEANKAAEGAALQARREGMSMEQATEWLSWLAALWDDDLPKLSEAYRSEMKRLPEVYQ